MMLGMFWIHVRQVHGCSGRVIIIRGVPRGRAWISLDRHLLLRRDPPCRSEEIPTYAIVELLVLFNASASSYR